MILLITNSLLVINDDCYCEHRNGADEKNAFLCKQGEAFIKSGQCKGDEWCVGPNNALDAVTGISELCTKGTGGSKFLFLIL